MTSPTLMPTLLTNLSSGTTVPAGLLAAQQNRAPGLGLFASELQRLQAQAPSVVPPAPQQPPTLPPATPPTVQAGTGTASGSPVARRGGADPNRTRAGDSSPRHSSGASSADRSGGAAGASTSGSSAAHSSTDTRPSDNAPTRNSQRTRTASSRADGGTAARTTSRADSRDSSDARQARLDREQKLRQRDADPAATAPGQPAPALPLPDNQPPPARAALGSRSGDAFVGPQADATTAGATAGDRAIPQVPGFDLLQGRATTAEGGSTNAAALGGAATPAPPRAALAGDTVPGRHAGSVAGVDTASAAGAAGPAGAEMQAVIANRQDDAAAVAMGPLPASSMPSFAAELARATGASSAAAPPAAPTPAPAAELTLPTPVTAPDFLPRLGGELAVLARDGVQEARINVHPVELGPISVQIALDGTAAQVHLAVESAQTRELLEQAMPTLAAALRDTGLTLTGGGVFQQSRQAPQDQPATEGRPNPPGRPGADDDGDLARLAAATPRRLRPLGALDVFA